MSQAIEQRARARHLVIGLLGALVAGVLLVSGIGRVAGFARLTAELQGADFRWLIMCTVGEIVVFVGYAGAFREAVEWGDGPPIPVAVSMRLVFASFAATQLFAFAGAGGLALMYWALRRVGMARDAAAVRLIGLNTAIYLVFGVIGFAAAAWSLLGRSAPLAMTIPWLVMFPLILLAARWFTTPHRNARWTSGEGSLARRAIGTGVEAATWVRRLLFVPEGRPLFGWAACYWIGDVASLWAALHAFGASPGLAPLTLAYATGYLAQSLPIPLIATSGVDAATTFLLHVIGVPLDVALVAIVAHRVFAFWLPVVPGSVFALTLPRLGRSLTRASSQQREPAVDPRGIIGG